MTIIVRATFFFPFANRYKLCEIPVIIVMLLNLVVLSYLSVFLCRVLNCQGFVYNLAQSLQQAIDMNWFTIYAALSLGYYV